MTDTERLKRYDNLLSAVMPPDFKDWWENSKDEWPDVAASVITSLQKREQFAWDQLDQRLTPQPVSVTDRFPGPEDCDADGRCWRFYKENDSQWNMWCYSQRSGHRADYWLPAHALPLPSKEVEG